MNVKEKLIELSNAAGYEPCAADYAAQLLAPYGEISRTALGSVICGVRKPRPGQPHLLLDAHFDIVELILTHIEDSGFLRVGERGGVDRRSLPACPVVVHGRKGRVNGIVCTTPPHLDKGGEKKFAKVDELYIDIGHTKEEAEKLIAPGDRVSLHGPAHSLLGDRVCGRALDNRAGCVSLLHALELLSDMPLACGLSVLFSSMEEVGGQGAKTAAHILEPTHAIVVDVSFAHTPDCARHKCGKMGGGPMIGHAPILSGAMTRRLIQTAQEQEIAFQHEVMGGRTGTNADHIATARSGVITGLISIPLAHMHTPIEIVAAGDVEATGKLIAGFIKNITMEGEGAL